MKKLNNINAIWGQVEQPKTSNDKITYHGDYNTFEDIDTSQFTDEILVWHTPEFPKEKWRYGLYGINNNEDNNYVEEEGVMTIELQKKYLIVRMLGNDLETLHGKNQTYNNLKFTIKNESSFINTDKLYILNRIADKEYKQQIITLLEATKQKYIDQPFEIEKFNKLPEINMSYEEFKQKNPEHPKSLIYYSSILKEHNLYLINNNGCRNFGLEYGKRNGYEWTFVLDSNSYFTDEYYNNIIKYISKNTHYIVIPQIRISDYNLENKDILNSNNLNRKFEIQEPQLAFHINSKYKFNELIPYGLSPKAEFLNAIQSKGQWNNWKDNELIYIKSRKFKDVKIQTLSNIIRLHTYNKNNKNNNNWITRWTGLFLLIQKIKDSNYMKEEVRTIELNNNNKYILLLSTSGFNDILCQIQHALKYCKKYNRILLIYGFFSCYNIDFSQYFELKNCIMNSNIIINILKQNLSSIYPEYFQNKILNVISEKSDTTFLFDRIYRRKFMCKIHNSSKIIMNIPDNNVNQNIILYAGGGGGIGYPIFKELIIKPILKNYCLSNYQKIPKPYITLQIRNTDYQCNYKDLYLNNKEIIHSYNAIYIATDDIDSLNYFKEQNLNIYNFTTFPKIKSKNLHWNTLISGDIKIKNLFSDLYIIAMSDKLLSNSTGGFIELARDIFKYKYKI